MSPRRRKIESLIHLSALARAPVVQSTRIVNKGKLRALKSISLSQGPVRRKGGADRKFCKAIDACPDAEEASDVDADARKIKDSSSRGAPLGERSEGRQGRIRPGR